MYLLGRLRFVTKRPKIHFEVKDLGDKKHIKLMDDKVKLVAGFVTKQSWSNTTEEEMKESLLLDYCTANHLRV